MIFLYIFLYVLIGCVSGRVIFVMYMDDEDMMLPIITFNSLLWPLVIVIGGAFLISRKPSEWIIRQIKK